MVDILAIGAHPDDVDFSCGGVLAKMVHQGKSVVIADMTLGEKGTHGTPEQRKGESEAAAAAIGANRVFLDFQDCQIIDSYENRLKLVRLIREHKPKLVLTSLWRGERNHPDHLATGLMTRYACRYARFANILPELPIHWVEGVLHYAHPFSEEIDILVDVSDYIEPWTKMMRCHKSQLTTYDYDQWNLKIAAKNGLLIGTAYAQGFVMGNPIVVEDLMSVAKGTREI